MMAAGTISIFVNSRTQHPFPRNHLHLRLAYRENVEVELDRLKRPVLGMPIADGRKVGIAMETHYLALC